jgi:hypothetical protein
MVRAKFRVMSVAQDVYQSAARTIKLAPHYDDAIPEDQRFAQATPTGELTMYVNNPRAVAELELGKYFYLDFVPVEE